MALMASGCGASTDQAETAVTVGLEPQGARSADPTEGTDPSAPGTTSSAGAHDTVAPPAQPPATAGETAEAEPAVAEPGTVRPAWLGTRVLPVGADGSVPPQETPPELLDRRFPTVDLLPPPPDDRFRATVEPVPTDVLDRSTWAADCPVTVDELRYLRLSFWGFDDRPHTGEMIVHRDVADDIVAVFRALFEDRFPIEEMRVTAAPELEAEPTGDGNNTTSFVCRAVVGGTRFSEHAYGLAVDVNPFHNPYRKGEVVLPELATAYLDRTDLRPGMIAEGDVVVRSFDEIGWGWGGRWRTLDDYHHFSHNNR